MSLASQLRRSFRKSAKFDITIIGVNQKTGRIQASASNTLVRVGVIKGYWFNPQKKNNQGEGGEMYSHEAIFHFLPEEMLNFEVAENYKVVRGNVTKWNDKELLEITALEKVNEVNNYFVYQFMLRKSRVKK